MASPQTPPESSSDQRLAAAALIEFERRKAAFPAYFYRPSRAIVPFHTSPCIIRQLCGGNRSGKTHSSVEEVIDNALGYRPWILREKGLEMPSVPHVRPANCPPEALCYTGAGIRMPVPNVGLHITGLPIKRGVGEIIAPKLEELGRGLIAQTWHAHSGVPIKVKFKNGSVLHFASDEQDVGSHEGTAYDYIAVDEPIKRSTYVALRRGSIDKFARIWLSYTPLGANANWLFKELYSKADNKRIFALTASIYNNDYLSPEAIAEFANDPAILDVEKEARLYGRFQSLIDRIYPEFHPDVHLIPAFRPPESWPIIHIVDPHTVRPWAMCWIALSPDGTCYVFRNWPEADFTKIRRDPRTVEEYNTLIRSLEGDRPSHHRLIDPNYGPRRDSFRGLQVASVVESMARLGLTFNHHLNDDLEHGESKVRSLLYYDTKRPVDSTNRPKLRIMENCNNVVSALSFYTAKSRPGTDGVPDETKRDETYKDFADLIRYFAVSSLASGSLYDTPSFLESPSSGDIDCSYEPLP